MFINLIRIQLFKLGHSRFMRWGAVVYFLATAAFFFTMINIADSAVMLDQPVFADSSADERRSLFAFLYLNVTVYLTNILTVGGIINLLVNHYENREKVNVSGIVRSPAVWYLSELAVAVIMVVAFGGYTIATTALLMVMMGIRGVDFISKQTLFLTLGGILSIFYTMEPAIPISKFFRKKNSAIAISIAYIVVKVLVLIFVAGFLTGLIGGSVSDAIDISTSSTQSNFELGEQVGKQLATTQVAPFIINPGTALMNWATGGTLGFSWVIFVIITIVRLAFYAFLGLLASLRKNEV